MDKLAKIRTVAMYGTCNFKFTVTCDHILVLHGSATSFEKELPYYILANYRALYSQESGANDGC